jgi:hypothetical protein
MKLLIVQFSPLCCYLLPFPFKRFPRRVLTHSECASLPQGARLCPVFRRNVFEKKTREWKFGNSIKCKNIDGNMMGDEPCRPARAYPPPPSPGPYSHRDAHVFTTNTSHPAVVQCVPSTLRAVLQGSDTNVFLLFKLGVGKQKAILSAGEWSTK